MKQNQLLEIMTNQEKTYIVFNNQLSIPASLLYEDWNLMTYSAYIAKCTRGKLIRLKMGKGKGNYALLSFHDLPDKIKAICIEKLGRHKKMQIKNLVIPQNDDKTYVYFHHQLSIPASLLYEDWKLMTYSNYIAKCTRGRLIRTKHGKGNGNFALLSYHDLPEDIKAICIEKLGDFKNMKIQTIQ